ncbi:hypothetical protein F0562_004217 [Nyssa sinensis]|uniref:Uncharacterized protein n=1 Tax=Nyssa sinensis TaxID=561372 RepID=A0A5J5BXX6_9ASTE|nr:hypothetical protein F0562_004217 [Nyssa sinensis]
MEEEDERREATIASAPSLQPNFKPSGVNQAQLTKFQELHRRRLQIKARSKIKTKSKGISDEASKSHRKHLDTEDCTDENLSETIKEDSSVSISKGNDIRGIPSLQLDNVAAQVASKKRQKLHWGLDTKERWERKANM